MKTQNITIIILAVLLLVVSFFLFLKEFRDFKQETFNQGYLNGSLDGQLLIIQRVQTGEIPVLTQQENQTQLNWIPIQQLCGG